MEINRHNYEAYLLDLLEGSLSVGDQQCLHDFLLLNPDCVGELAELEPWFLEPAKMHYPDREILKRELPHPTSVLTYHNFDLFSIARMEGDLTIEQEEAHQKMVDEELQKKDRWIDWQQTKLVPAALVYKYKDELTRKRGVSRRVIWLGVISAAAAIAMVIVLFRTEPAIPQRELSLQTPSRSAFEQPLDVLDQPVIQLELPGTEEILEAEQSPVLPVRKPEQAINTELSRDPVSVDNLQPRPLKITDNKVYQTSPAGNPTPDQIKPLDIPPVHAHLSSLSVAQISDLELGEVIETYTQEKDITLWNIASAGIKGINKIAGSEISLLASRNEEGEVSGFLLKSRRFSLTRPVGKEE